MIRESTPEARRERILAATVDVVRTRGFAGARVADIARAAGTSSGLVLYHFGSLDGALTQTLTWLEDAYYADLATAVQTSNDPVARLAVMADLGSSSGHAISEWALWLELWVRALRDDKARAVRAAFDDRWRSMLHDVIRDGASTGRFTVADPWATALRLACLMDGLAIQLALGDPELDPARFRSLWLGSAALELGLDPSTFGMPASGGERAGLPRG